MTLMAVRCAVCDGADFEPVFPSAIADPESDPAAYFSSSRQRAGHLEIVRCRQCTLLLTNPRDDDETLARVYGELADTEYASEEDNRRRTAANYLHLIGTDHPHPGRLLDVGCATGVFAELACARGWQVTGLDASPWAIARARERCPRATFVAGLIEDAPFAGSTFGVITMWDVMEHVRSPRDTLRHLHECLAPGGMVYLNVPNADSAVARLMGRHWILLLREHLWYFSPATMTRLLNDAGFDLMWTRPNQVRFSLANILKRSAQYPNALGTVARYLAGRETTREWLRQATLRFPIGEMTVLAKKRG
jgi:2-polyprenyl-3-methyl-5-hydroxy-6-metoxy-1,4-benzoquinol methylase